MGKGVNKCVGGDVGKSIKVWGCLEMWEEVSWGVRKRCRKM